MPLRELDLSGPVAAPVRAVDESADGGVRDAGLAGNGPAGAPPGVLVPGLANLGIGEAAHTRDEGWETLMPCCCLPALGDLVGIVDGGSAEEQVSGVAAWRVVAAVQNIERTRIAEGEQPCDAVGTLRQTA